MSGPKPDERPNFSYSYLKPISGFVVFLILLGLVGISDSVFQDFTGAVVLVLFACLFVASILSLSALPVHRAKFFDDYFVVGGRITTKRVEYSEIARVFKDTRFRILSPFTQIVIDFKEHNASVVVPSNPYSRRLKTDLYGWLSMRIPRNP